MSSLYEQNKDKLLSLGFAFYGRPPKRSADPEQTILDLLPAFFVDRKLFRMLLAWLEITSDYIHIERLKALSKNLATNHKVILGVVAKKMERRDRRWKIIHERMKEDLLGLNISLQVPGEFNDPYLISKYGKDEEFASFGVESVRVTPEDEKKIHTVRAILRANAWLRLRALMGPNFRTDVAYLLLSNLADGPSKAARILGCSRDAAYRNWRAMEEADVRKMVKISV